MFQAPVSLILKAENIDTFRISYLHLIIISYFGLTMSFS